MSDAPAVRVSDEPQRPVIATLTDDGPEPLMYMPLWLEEGDGVVRLRVYLEGMEARLLAAIGAAGASDR